LRGQPRPLRGLAEMERVMYELGASIALSVCLPLRFVPWLNDVVLGKLGCMRFAARRLADRLVASQQGAGARDCPEGKTGLPYSAQFSDQRSLLLNSKIHRVRQRIAARRELQHIGS